MNLFAEAVFNLDLSPPVVAEDDEVADVAADRSSGEVYEVAELAEACVVGGAYEVAELAAIGSDSDVYEVAELAEAGVVDEAYEVAELAEARSGDNVDEVAEVAMVGARASEGVEEHAVEVDGVLWVPSRRLVELIEARLAYINGEPDYF